MAAYRELVYETPGFTDYFFAATPIREIAELNIGSRPASRKADARDRGPARHPVGLQLGPVPRGAARLVRLRLGASRRSWRGDAERPPTSAGAAAAHARAVAVLPHAAVEPRHGARQERPRASPRAMSSWWRTRALGRKRSSRRSRPSGSAPRDALTLITGEKQRLASNPAWRARSRIASRTSTR